MFYKINIFIAIPIICLHLESNVFVILLKVTTQSVEQTKKIKFYSELRKFSIRWKYKGCKLL